MIADKYLALPYRKQYIFDIEIVRLQTPAGDIPVIATCERGRVTIAAWNPGIANVFNTDVSPRWQTAIRSYAIGNPSFENADINDPTHPADWEITMFDSEGTVALDASPGNQTDGAKALAFTSTGPGRGGGVAESTVFRIDTGLAFLLSVSRKSNWHDVRNVIEAVWLKADRSELSTTTLLDEADGEPPTDWTGFASSVMPPDNANFCRIRLTGCHPSAAAGTTWFDNVRIRGEGARVHQFLNVPDPTGSDPPGGSRNPARDMAQTPTWPFSQRVGLAAVHPYVFLVFKRRIRFGPSNQFQTGLFIDRFEWNGNAGVLQYDTTFRVLLANSLLNLGNDPGFFLWAGYSEVQNRLLLLTQVRVPQGDPACQLALYQADMADPAVDLGLAGSWDRPAVIGSGGFDLDVHLEPGRLSCIYRREPYAFSIDLLQPSSITPDLETQNPTIPIPDESTADDFYEPLVLKTIELATGNIIDYSDTLAPVPGGEKPQIQSMDPIMLTIDRISVGTFEIRYSYFPLWDDWGSGENFAVHITPKISSCQKILLIERNGQWARGNLNSLRPDYLPSTLRWMARHQFMLHVANPTADSLFLHYASLNSCLPMYLVDVQPVPEKKSVALFFMYHNSVREAVWRSRYLVNDSGAQLAPQEDFFWTVDINHYQINSGPSAEIYQFCPLRDPFWQAGELPSTHLNPSPSVGFYLGTPGTYFDNTIGGSLRVERRDTGVVFYAYTDLGDGGCRVIFDDDIKLPEPQTLKKHKYLDDLRVHGSGSGADRIIEINQNQDWETFSIPLFAEYDHRRPYWANGQHKVLDNLLLWGGGELGEETFFQYTAEDIQNFLIAIRGPTISSETDNPNPPFLLIEPPASLFSGIQVSFRATYLESDPGNIVFQWEFGDDTDTVVNTLQNGHTVSVPHIYNIPDDEDGHYYQGSVSATDENNNTRTVNFTVLVTKPLWDLMWDPRDLVNDTMPVITGEPLAEVGSATLNIPSHEIEFVATEQNERDKVIIKREQRLDGEYQFIGQSGVQGAINYRFKVKFNSGDIAVKHSFLAPFIRVDKLDVEAYYGRMFTPALLMSDRRHLDPVTGGEFDGGDEETVRDGWQMTGSVLSAKPYNKTFCEFDKVSVKVSLTSAGKATAAVLGVLAHLGLGTWKEKLLGLIAFLAIVVSSPFTFWLGALISAAIVIFIVITVPSVLSGYVERKIREQVDQFKESLDNTQLIWYSGEGLAEAIAVRAIEQGVADGTLDATQGLNAEEDGRHRFRDQFWQMLYVKSRLCSIKVRP